MAVKSAFATKRLSEKYTVMCHDNGLLVMTTNACLNQFWGVSASPLLRREARSLRPPSPVEYLASAGDYGRVSGFRAWSGLGCQGESSRRQERFARKSREEFLEPRSWPKMGDSESFPCQPKLRHWYEASYYRTKGGISVEKLDR